MFDFSKIAVKKMFVRNVWKSEPVPEVGKKFRYRNSKIFLLKVYEIDILDRKV